MINAFPRSRRIATWGGTALGVLAAAAAWVFLSGRAGGFNHVLVSALAAFVGVNIMLYTARLAAMKEYNERLLLLYEKLDPQRFLQEVLPLREKKMNASSRCELLVHIANGRLYAGQPEKALELLDEVEPPENALEMRGLVLGNKATCYLAQGNPDRAQKAMDELLRIAGAPACKKEFAQKARHTLGYLQLCMNVQRGRSVDPAPLEKDLEGGGTPLHRLDVQYRLAQIYRRRGDTAAMERMREALLREGGKTCFVQLAQQL